MEKCELLEKVNLTSLEKVKLPSSIICYHLLQKSYGGPNYNVTPDVFNSSEITTLLCWQKISLGLSDAAENCFIKEAHIS